MKAILVVLLATAYFAQTQAAGTYTGRFLTQYHKIKNSKSGYFSKHGVPYHSVETMCIEAPDHGHETTSEAYSYYVYLEAMYGAIEGDFSNFNAAWNSLESQIIPKLQPTNSFYTPAHPATYAAEHDTPNEYPSQIETGVSVGSDPIANELASAYGTHDMYSMHWLLDVDNIYGFGNAQGKCEAGPKTDGASFINTFQRGSMESVWRTIPQPTCDDFTYGGKNGYLDLFTKDSSYAKQWKYTAAPDADARAIQAAYWASVWAHAKGKASSVSGTLNKAAKMGDYLRYAMYDKYFKKIGNCVGPTKCAAGNGKDSAHYLIGWYFAWGGSRDTQSGWAWRISDSASHFGYQNPLTAHVLSSVSELKPKGATAVQDWHTSLERQLALYKFLQTSEGAFAGGVTNSWNNRYDTPSSNLTGHTFNGMFYDWEPVYHNPPSNRWFGMQPWSADRLAQYYYVTGDSTAKAILDKWVTWILKVVTSNGKTFKVPDHLGWSGVPPNVHVTVQSYGEDVGSAAATARALSYYAAKSHNAKAKALAKNLLDALWSHQDSLGIAIAEARDDYKQFHEEVYVPKGWTGKNPNGDEIKSGVKFIDIRSFYKKDASWAKVEKYLVSGGAAPTFTFHRFWSQSDIALAFGAYGLLFNE